MTDAHLQTDLWISQPDDTPAANDDRPRFEPGIYTDISNSDYHASHGISNSGLSRIAQSPAHFKYPKAKSSTRAMEIGSAIHCAILEPERYIQDYRVVECDARTSSLYKAACKDRDSSLVLTMAEADNVNGMQESAYRNMSAASLLLDTLASRELSVYAKDPETGLLVKCRFDLLTKDLIALDLKKTQDARADAFSRSIFNYWYHRQAAFYSDVLFWATGERLKAWKFLAMEEQSPYACKVYQLDEEAMEIGRVEYRMALDTYAECVESGEWPAYGGDEEVISLPGWAFSKFEDQLEVEFGDE